MSAKRRRERRLRQWQRHEQMTVAIALAEATHHAAPRRQKPVFAIREHATHWPVLAEVSGDAVDASTLRFLTAAARLAQRQQRLQQPWEVDQEWDNRPTRRKRKKGRRKRLPKASSSLLRPVRGSRSEIWTSFLWFFLVFGVWVLPDVSWIIGFLEDDFYTHMRQSTRHLSGILRPLVVSGSRLFGAVLEEFSYVDFQGDDFRIHRTQRFLVRQWIHVNASLRSLWVLFPYTAQCLVLFGTRYASVTEFLDFHLFTWKSTSDPEVDSRRNCGLSAVAAQQQGRPHSCHDAVAVSHGSDCLVDHRDSPVALRHCVRCPCCVDVQYMLLHARTALGTWTVFHGPGSGSLVRYSSPEQYKIRIFLEMTSRTCFLIRRMLWFTVDTSTCTSEQTTLHYTTPHHTTPPPPPKVRAGYSVLRGDFLLSLHVSDARASVRTCEGVHAQCCTRCGSCHEKAAATFQAVATARTLERRNGPCRDEPPRSPTGTDEGKGRGEVSTSCTARPRSGRTPPSSLSQEPGTHYSSMGDESVSELGGGRPPRLGEPPGAQAQVQRHTVEQLADFNGAVSRRTCAADG